MAEIKNIVNKILRMRGKDVDKALFLNSWIYGSLALSVKDRESDGTDETINKLNGACGHRDYLFRQVAEEVGWKSRRVGFHDVPVQLAHVATEVYIDGDWRFFDSTFGVYLTSLDEKKDILSIQRARQLYPNVQVMQASQKPYLGKWLLMVDRSYKPVKGQVFNHPYGDWQLGEIDATYFLSQLILETEDWHYNSQFAITLKAGESLQFDEAELSKNHLPFPYGESYVGYAALLGKYWGRGPVIEKRFAFIADTALRAEISMKMRHIQPENVHASMRLTVSDFSANAMAITKKAQDDLVSWSFMVHPPMTTIRIQASHGESAVIELLSIKAYEASQSADNI